MKFRKKPVVINAMQFDGTNHFQLMRWAEQLAGEARWHFDSKPDPMILITTLEGVMRADVGDWIVIGVKGEQYPCKPDVFEATYELAEAPCSQPKP